MSKLSIILLILLGMLVLWAICDMIYDIKTYRVTSYELTSSKIKKEFRFVVLSDLHNKKFGKNNDKLIAGIRQLHPDAVMVAGDMLTAAERDDISGTVHLLTTLAKDYPVYYGIGNHEEKLKRKTERYGSIYGDYMSALTKAGVRPLINEKRTLSEYGISVCGLQIGPKYFKRFRLPAMSREDLRGMIGVPERDHYQILIAHHPDYFPQYAEWGADLVLSGHNHGGIVRIPFLGGMVSPRCILFPKYDGGRFERGSSTMLLSRGLGTHTLPVRVLNHAELLYVTCRPDR